MRLHIASTGYVLPPEVEDAEALSERIGRSAQWISLRTGVERRHVWRGDMGELGAQAVRAALGDGPRPDLLLNASAIPHQVLPDSSVFVQQALGWEGVPSFSVHASCLSFLVALHTAGALLTAGAYRRIAIVSADLGSRGRNTDEPESAALLGDGAAAAVVTAPPDDAPGSELLAWKMSTWPAGAHLTEVRGGGTRLHPNDPRTTEADNLFHMNGMGVYRMAVRKVEHLLDEVLGEAGIQREELACIVPHQASGNGLKALARYGLSPDRTIHIIAEQGNCVAASIPLALAWAHENGRLERGAPILLVGTGAGLSVAAAVLRW